MPRLRRTLAAGLPVAADAYRTVDDTVFLHIRLRKDILLQLLELSIGDHAFEYTVIDPAAVLLQKLHYPILPAAAGSINPGDARESLCAGLFSH